jgi:transcriptional regulator with XRE-family HTH domain
MANANHHIRAWRKHRGYTTRALAERTGLAPSTIGGLETGSGQYSQGSLERIAEALGTTPAALLNGPPGAKEKPPTSSSFDWGQLQAAADIFRIEVNRAVDRAAAAMVKRLRSRP